MFAVTYYTKEKSLLWRTDRVQVLILKLFVQCRSLCSHFLLHETRALVMLIMIDIITIRRLREYDLEFTTKFNIGLNLICRLCLVQVRLLTMTKRLELLFCKCECCSLTLITTDSLGKFTLLDSRLTTVHFLTNNQSQRILLDSRVIFKI